jgi:hypothetical protein
MTVFAVLSAVAAAGCLVALAVDDRVLLGAPIWTKPFKFAVSMTAYCLAWSWMYSMVERGRRVVAWAGSVVVASMAVEYVIIVGQVLRGRASHFNVSTPLDAGLWAAMSVTIGVLWLAILAMTVVVLRAPLADAASRWAVRSGAVISLVGLGLGGLMVGAARGDGGAGAHTVGLPDGGPGMALTGWSTVGGDLRIPHFVGMHALQVLPLLAALLGVLGHRLPRLGRPEVRARLVLVAASGYAGLVALVTWQAERGQSLVHPDAVTLGALAVLLAGLALGSVWALVPAEPGPVGAARPAVDGAEGDPAGVAGR